MKNIDELICSPFDEQEIIFEGYIVYLDDGGLYVIGLDYGEDYTKAPSLAVKNKNLSDNLEANVSLYGGGELSLIPSCKVDRFIGKGPCDW